MPGRDARTPDLRALKIAAKPLDGRTEPRDGSQLGRQQHPALSRLDQARIRSVCFCQRRSTGVFHHAACGGGFLHPGFAEPFAENRFRFRQALFRGLRNRLVLKLYNDSVKPECYHILCHVIPLFVF